MADALIRHVNLLFASKSYEFDLKNKILSTENYDKEYRFLKENTTKNQQDQVKHISS